MSNFHDNYTTIELVAPARKTATANGTGFDLRDYDGETKIILSTSAGGGTTPTLDVKIQDSADNSTFTDVSGKAFAQVTDAADYTGDLEIVCNEVRRYIRAVITITGTSPTFDMALVAVAKKQVV